MARLTETDKIDARLAELDKMRERARGQITGWDAEAGRLNKRRTWLLSDPDLQPDNEVTAPVMRPVPEHRPIDDATPLPPEPADGGDPEEDPDEEDLDPNPHPLPGEADPWEYPGPEGAALGTVPVTDNPQA